MNKHYYGSPPRPADTQKLYDFCIIGSGAAGSVAAKELVSAGYQVMMIEKGPYVRKGLSYDDILQNAEPAFARMENGTWGLIGYPWTTCNVGGGTVFYGGVSLRYRDIDFNPLSISSFSNEVEVEWPYSGKELSAYYSEIETILGVSGDPLQDPFRPNTHTHLPNPPHPYSPQAELLYRAGRKMGLSPFPTPLAILSRDSNGKSKCNYCSACIEHQCLSHSKSDSLSILNPIKLNNNFSLFAGLNALQLKRTSSSTISSILCQSLIDENLYEFRAQNFIVAANAIQSARLLLNSSDKWDTKGIGNNYGLLGKTFCQKLSGYVIGYLPQSQGTSVSEFSMRGPFSTIAFTDYYISNEFPFSLGGLIYEAKYGFSYQGCSEGYIVRLECIIGDLPEKRNQILIRNDQVVMDYNPNPFDIIRLRILMEKAKSILQEAGCTHISFESSGYGLGSGHLHGTCRYGSSEKSGVVNENSQVYGTDNLWVIDGSFMPYPGGVNPTLTIQAHALKSIRHIIRAHKKEVQ